MFSYLNLIVDIKQDILSILSNKITTKFDSSLAFIFSLIQFPIGLFFQLNVKVRNKIKTNPTLNIFVFK